MEGRPSVVLKEGQEVIVTIARQVGRIQVREELVGICEFWKELEKKYRSPDEGPAEGLGRPREGTAGVLALSLLPGVLAGQGKLTAAGRPQMRPGHRASLRPHRCSLRVGERGPRPTRRQGSWQVKGLSLNPSDPLAPRPCQKEVWVTRASQEKPRDFACKAKWPL